MIKTREKGLVSLGLRGWAILEAGYEEPRVNLNHQRCPLDEARNTRDLFPVLASGGFLNVSDESVLSSNNLLV